MSADSSKGEAAAQEAKFGGFYSWRPSEDATFFPVRIRFRGSLDLLSVIRLLCAAFTCCLLQHNLAMASLCRGGRRPCLRKTSRSGTSVSFTQR